MLKKETGWKSEWRVQTSRRNKLKLPDKTHITHGIRVGAGIEQQPHTGRVTAHSGGEQWRARAARASGL
jgi:hypothetical protein